MIILLSGRSYGAETWDPEGYSLAQSSGLPPSSEHHPTYSSHSYPLEPLSSSHPALSITDSVSTAHSHRTAAAHLAALAFSNSGTASAAASAAAASQPSQSLAAPQRFSLDEEDFPALMGGGPGGGGGKRGSSSSTPNNTATGQSSRSLASSPMASTCFPTGITAHFPRLSLGAAAAAATASLHDTGAATAGSSHPTSVPGQHAAGVVQLPVAGANGSAVGTGSAVSTSQHGAVVGPMTSRTGFAAVAAPAGWARPAGQHPAAGGGVAPSGYSTLLPLSSLSVTGAASAVVGGDSGSHASRAPQMSHDSREPGSSRSKQAQIDRREAVKTKKGG